MSERDAVIAGLRAAAASRLPSTLIAAAAGADPLGATLAMIPM